LEIGDLSFKDASHLFSIKKNGEATSNDKSPFSDFKAPVPLLADI
jgi:hypothetical protein